MDNPCFISYCPFFPIQTHANFCLLIPVWYCNDSFCCESPDLLPLVMAAEVQPQLACLWEGLSASCIHGVLHAVQKGRWTAPSVTYAQFLVHTEKVSIPCSCWSLKTFTHLAIQHVSLHANYILAPACKCYENGGVINSTDSSRPLGSRS